MERGLTGVRPVSSIAIVLLRARGLGRNIWSRRLPAKIWRHFKQRTFGDRGALSRPFDKLRMRRATRRRRSEMASTEQLQRVPSARSLARLMTTGRDTLSKSETIAIAAIKGAIRP